MLFSVSVVDQAPPTNPVGSSRRPDRVGLCSSTGRDSRWRADVDNARIDSSAPHVGKTEADTVATAVAPNVSPLGLFSSGFDQCCVLFIS